MYIHLALKLLDAHSVYVLLGAGRAGSVSLLFAENCLPAGNKDNESGESLPYS